jgi:hypothetical protein
MKVFWHKKEGNKRLLFLFNGWGFDPKIFQDTVLPCHDVVSVYDYSDTDPMQFDFTKSYVEVKIMAWSYGVFVADFFSDFIFNLRKAVAVNGSTTPVDDEKGIPVKIFLATMNSFNVVNREKFYIRLVGGLSAYKLFAGKLPDRSLDNQLDELKFLYHLSAKNRSGGLKWNIAVISTHDRIFPLANMKRAWGDRAMIVDKEHYPDFNELLKLI